jgi:hypothetical protein
MQTLPITMLQQLHHYQQLNKLISRPVDVLKRAEGYNGSLE